MNYCTSHCYFQVYIRIILTTTTDKKLKFISEKFLQELFKQLDLLVIYLLTVGKKFKWSVVHLVAQILKYAKYLLC